MMQARKSWQILNLSLLLTSVLIFSGCSMMQPKERIVTQIEIIEREIPIQPRPNGLTLFKTQFYAVTAENYEEFVKRFERENGDLVYFAISIPGYENLALSLADVKRYIEQQQAIILYYENQASGTPEIEETE